MLIPVIAAVLVSGLVRYGAPDGLQQRGRTTFSEAGKAKKGYDPFSRAAQQQDPSAGASGVDEGKKPLELSWRYGKIFRLDVDATFQEDLHASYEGADAKAGLKSLELQRHRVGIHGAFFKHIEFEVAREVTEQDVEVGKRLKSPWKDADVNLTYFKNAQLQLGKFKVPFGLDALTGTRHNDFVYRSLGADYLAPGRDIGAMVHGRFFKRGLSYWAGVFRHDGDNATSSKVQGGDRTFAARVTGRPLRRAKVAGLGRVELGTAFTVSAVSDDSFQPKGLRGRTVMTANTFFHPVYVKGRRYRWEGDLDWKVGPASLRAEYTRVTDERLGQGYADQDLPDARYRSWYIGGTYVLTGEKAKNGAVEAVARYERVWFDSVGGHDEGLRNPRAETIFPSGECALTLGVNWALNRFITLKLNTIREVVSDRDRSPTPNGAGFWSRVLRFQFVL